MATLVGSVDWKPMRRNTWWTLPAGTAEGDIAIAVVVADRPTIIPPGFTAAASRSFGVALAYSWAYQVYLSIATRTVTAGLTQVGWDETWPQRPGDMAVLVFRGTQGVGVTRTEAQVPVRDNGAAVLLAGGYTAPTVPSGPSWSAAHRVSTPLNMCHVLWGWQALPGGGVAGGSVFGGRGLAIELLPPATPLPPLLTAPEDGAEVTVTAQTPLVLSWRHRPSRSGGTQDAFEVRREVPGLEPQWWSVASQAWSDVAIINPGAAASVSLPVAATTANQSVRWSVRTREALDGTWSDWAPEHTFMRVTPPSVTVTGPAATVNDDLSPDVTWTPTTPRGVQTAWRVRIVQSASGVQVWDSGVVAGDAHVVTVPASTPWVRGQQYQAVVSVQQTGGSWSPEAQLQFTMSWTQPPLPAVTLDTDGPGVGVAVAAGADLAVEVQRSTDGAQFVPLATWTGGGGRVRDVFATYGLPTRYRARTGTVLEGQRLWSDWVTAGPITSTDHCSYIASAVDPVATWQRLFIRADNTRRHVRETAVDYGLGDTRPRVSHGPHRGMAGSMEARTETAADTDALEALLLSGEVLQVRMPADGRAITGRDLPEIMTVAVAAAPTRDRLAHTAIIKGRIINFDWVEQSPPPLGASMAPVSHPIDRTGA